MPTLVPNDHTILDLLRRQGRMTVADFEETLGVTATAVRQRLNRLLSRGYIERHKDATASGRGRPSHWYRLTKQGSRRTGSNFADLAMALWGEVRSIDNVEIKRGLLQRISQRLAGMYRAEVQATDISERAGQVASLFQARRIPFDVEHDSDGLPILTAHACPYPELAEQDRSICAMERMLFSELMDRNMTLDQCRLNGDSCCTFQLQETATGTSESTGAESTKSVSDG